MNPKIKHYCLIRTLIIPIADTGIVRYKFYESIGSKRSIQMKNPHLIALRSFVVAAGATAAASFVGVYGVLLGATPSEMGFLQSTSNSLSNAGQILWGRISDRFGTRLPFLIMGSLSLMALWFMMPFVRDPVNLIVLYSLISLFSAMITVNWYAFIADNVSEVARGKFLSTINNLSSIGTIISIAAMSLFFTADNVKDLAIPFFAAATSYLISAILLKTGNEKKVYRKQSNTFVASFREMRRNRKFYSYFVATTTQAYFWSMAWPLFPITIISVMGFSVQIVAYLTIASLSVTIASQYFFGRFVDRVNRVPLIFFNRLMLCVIPLMYAFFVNLGQFFILEFYSGFVGAIQSVVMTSYLLDIAPSGKRAEYISVLNGANGIVYFLGAISGGFMLQYLVALYPLRYALMLGYLVVFAGRFLSSFLFLRLQETGGNNRRDLALFSILLRWRHPGSPSGGNLGPK
jgi:MFS family permease